METRLKISNSGKKEALIYVEPEAVEHVVKPSSAVTIVEHHPPKERSLSIFVFDDGVSLYGWEIEVKPVNHIPQMDNIRAVASDEVDHVLRANRPARSNVSRKGVCNTIRVYRPTETNSSLTVLLRPSGEPHSIEPGQSLNVDLAPTDDSNPELDLIDGSIALTGTLSSQMNR
jgi:hypothetical protein